MGFWAKSKKSAYDRKRYIRLKGERLSKMPPDAILGLTQEQRAYIAGLIDGEGSILIKEYKRPSRVTVYPEVAIRMASHAVLEWLRKITQAPKLCTSKPRRSKYTGHLSKPQWVFRMTGKRAQLICRSLLPYMRVKHRQAKLVLTFPCDARIAPGFLLAQSKVNPIRYRIKRRISRLNHSTI